MKVKIFFGDWYEVQDAFNAWAKGKSLTREVLIHEQVIPPKTGSDDRELLIIVYHPESDYWDSTKSKPIQRVQSEAAKSFGLEHKDDRILLAPIHEEPEPHIKVEEAQVTQ